MGEVFGAGGAGRGPPLVGARRLGRQGGGAGEGGCERCTVSGAEAGVRPWGRYSGSFVARSSGAGGVCDVRSPPYPAGVRGVGGWARLASRRGSPRTPAGGGSGKGGCERRTVAG